MFISRSTVVGLAIALVINGFALFAALSEFLGIPSTPVSITVRAATLALCALAMLMAVRGHPRTRLTRWMIGISIAFWSIYLLRTAVDTTYNPYLLYEPSSYWIWGVGGSMLPMVFLSLARVPTAKASQFFRIAFLTVLIASALAIPLMTTFVASNSDVYSTGRAALAALNPISLGHLGVQLILMSMWAVFLNDAPSSMLRQSAYGVCAVLGLYLAIAANSRGPLVAMIVAVIVAILASRLRRKYWLVGLVTLAAAFFAPMLAAVDAVAGTNVFDRLLGQSQLEEVNTRARVDLYQSALNNFLDSPLTGIGLEDPLFGGYPHNLTIESFMSTGLIGGLLFLAITGLTFLASFHVLRQIPAYGWLALITVQQTVSVQFSGSIGQATTFWGLFGALAAVASARHGPAQLIDHARRRPNAVMGASAANVEDMTFARR